MINVAQTFITNLHVSIDMAQEPDWEDIQPAHLIHTAANYIIQIADVPAQCGNPAHDVFTFDDDSAFVMVRDSHHLYRIASTDDLEPIDLYNPERHTWLIIGDQKRGPEVRRLLHEIAD